MGKQKRELESQSEQGTESSELKKKKMGEDQYAQMDEDILKVPEMSENDRLEEAMEAGKETRYLSYIQVPSQEDIKQALLRRKKQELLMQYDLEDEEIIDSKSTVKDIESDIKSQVGGSKKEL